MKDTKGVEYAMKISKEVWVQSIPGAITSGMRKPPMKQPLPRGVAPSAFYPRAARLGPNASLDFSPVGSIGEGYHRMMDDSARFTEVRTPVEAPHTKTESIESPMETSVATVPGKATVSVVTITENTIPKEVDARKVERLRSPAGVRRLSFDSTSMSTRKKQKQEYFPNNEMFVDLFGPDLPALPISKSLYIFQFLSKSDLYHASLTSREWNILVTDKLSPD
jgi:hypothetical protein